MSRRIRATVCEELTEHTVIEVDVPDDLDLSNKEAVDEFLEMTWTEGGFKAIDAQGQVAIHERWFEGAQEVQP